MIVANQAGMHLLYFYFRCFCILRLIFVEENHVSTNTWGTNDFDACRLNVCKVLMMNLSLCLIYRAVVKLHT